MENIKLGILGLKRGVSFLVAFNCMADVDVVAICETDKATIEEHRSRIHENTKIFDSFDEFIDCGLDAVVLADYFHTHARHAIIALNKGIHVLSETNAAATLGECVDLCEAVERSGCKYMLASNVPYMNGPREVARLYREAGFGRVLYAEGEYLHPLAPHERGSLDPNSHHWRNYLPRTYYNMHDFGTLMKMTKTLPKKVHAVSVWAPDIMKVINPNKRYGDIAAIILTEMDNGAVFRSTSCASLGPMGKWFRLTCENGTIETKRGDQDSILYRYNDWSVPEGGKKEDAYPAEAPTMTEEMRQSGHGGTDYGVDRDFIMYLRGEIEPFFDVYRSTTLAAAGILAWRSVLNNGIGYDVPDFSDKEARKTVADDFLSPFPDENGNGATLTCSSREFRR